MITIEKIKNGWLVSEGYGDKGQAFLNEQDLFDHLFQALTGRAEFFAGESYGKITLDLGKEDGE